MLPEEAVLLLVETLPAQDPAHEIGVEAVGLVRLLTEVGRDLASDRNEASLGLVAAF
jgi:hypothetical protein